MQLGIHVGTFRRPMLSEILDTVVEHGFSCVHFNMAAAGVPSMPERVEEELREQIAAEMTARELSIASLSGTFNMIHPNEDVRCAGLRRLEAIAEAARPIGASLITLCTGTRDPDHMWRRHEENDTPEAFDQLLDTMARALEIAERCDVTLGVEPEVNNVIDSAARARRLLDAIDSPRLKIIIDGANLFHAGELKQMHVILGEAFDLLGKDIALAHAKDLDHDGDAGHIAAGKGLLDYDYYLASLKRVGFDGPLILHGLDEDEVAECVEFLQEKLAEL